MKLSKYLISISIYLVSSISSAATIPNQGTWENTLQGRDLDGDLSTFEAYYDTTLNITWLSDVMYSGALMNWVDANDWAATLSIGGITGWRLPNANPIDGSIEDDSIVSAIGSEDRAYNVSAPGTLYAGSTASELAHLFYNTLGNLGYCDPALSTVSSCSAYSNPVTPQSELFNSALFSNLMGGGYWAAQEYAPSFGDAWSFEMNTGFQGGFSKHNNNYAWAVHDGDVALISSVPVPAAAWLFASGLLGLLGVLKRKNVT